MTDQKKTQILGSDVTIIHDRRWCSVLFVFMCGIFGLYAVSVIGHVATVALCCFVISIAVFLDTRSRDSAKEIYMELAQREIDKETDEYAEKKSVY